MHLAHEFVKMQPHLAPDGHGVEKAVHQEAFATPHPTVHVNPQRNLRPVDQLFEAVGTLAFVGGPVIGAALQCCNGTLLRRVGVKTLGSQFGLVGLDNRVGQGSFLVLLF